MKEIKQDRKSRYTRKVLRESLVELMKDKPISKITVKELCENADINRTTFYAHYRDQYDLLQHIEEETLTAIENILDTYKNKNGSREHIEMTEEIFSFIAGNSNSIQTLLSENGDIEFQKRLFRRFMRKEQLTKYFSKTPVKAEREYQYVYVINGAVGLMQHWLKDNMSLPISAVARMLIKFNK
ncbi:MAG: TetR/AcrR family transcriptional regulator [Spirochaetaceae bacterium]|jgi:AcrR family transcriptional regulator|nr:TetR/AcrR family transcriptional regulator [Spirochaetaceae bacterium]